MNDMAAVWPDWQLAELIGVGGWSKVYRAERRDQKDIQAAVKVMTVPAAEAENILEEIRRMKRFEGTSHIVSIEDYAILPETEGQNVILIRMELLTPLRSYLSDRELSEREVLRMGIALCEGLALCHRNSILHGDIKPDNILVKNDLSSGALYKLGDFGLAGILGYKDREAEDGTDPDGVHANGTPEYMAPEQLEGKQDERSDLYSLGIMIYRYLNGDRLPFLSPLLRVPSHDDRVTALKFRLSGTPLPPASGASPETMAILWKACAWQADDRYSSADEFRQAMEERLALLDADLSAGTAEADAAGPERKRRYIKKKNSSIRRLAGALVVLAVIAAFVWNAFLRAPDESPQPTAGTPVPLLDVEIRDSSGIENGLTALWNAWMKEPRNTLPETLRDIPFIMEAGNFAPTISLHESEGLVQIRIDPEWKAWSAAIEIGKYKEMVCGTDEDHQCRTFKAELGWKEKNVILSRDAGHSAVQYVFRCSDGELSRIVLLITPGGQSERLQVLKEIPAAAAGPGRWTLTMRIENGVLLTGQYSEEGELIR